MLSELLVSIFVILLLWFYLVNKKPPNYPKGPISFPLVGNFPQLMYYNNGEFWHLLFMEYKKSYGDLIYLDLASYPCVIINDLKLVKEAFSNPLLCGRPPILTLTERTGGVTRGILFKDGHEWMEQRRFTLRHLRDFGFGKRSMETLILDEISDLLKGLKEDAGQPIQTQCRFNVAVLNALWTIVSGERLKHDDPELIQVMQAITRSTTAGGLPEILASFLPGFVQTFPNLTGWANYKKDLVCTYEFLQRLSKRLIDSYNGNSQDTFAQVYIQQIKSTTDPDSSFYGKRGEMTMTAVLQDLFVAGAETTSTTLTWACLYLALYPEKQKKLLDEIDHVLGNKEPSIEDRFRMPYTEALIMETLRYSSMVPLGVLHRATQDVVLDGRLIPKNSIVFANLYGVHHDPDIWGDPETFRPERFLNPDGSCNTKNEALLPFSYGKRVCLGETLARVELFLFITSLFRVFEVTWDPAGPKPSEHDMIDATVLAPKPHKLIFTERC